MGMVHEGDDNMGPIFDHSTQAPTAPSKGKYNPALKVGQEQLKGYSPFLPQDE